MKTACYAFALFLVPLLCAAETPDERFELTINAGVSVRDFEQEEHPAPHFVPGVPYVRLFQSSVDSGLFLHVKAGYYLTNHLQVEGNFGTSPLLTVRTVTFFECREGEICSDFDPVRSNELDGSSTLFGGNVVYNFHSDNFTPFLSAGVGGVSTNVGLRVTDFAFNFGGGIKMYFGKIGLRFEVTDQMIFNYRFSDKTEHDIKLGTGLLLRF